MFARIQNNKVLELVSAITATVQQPIIDEETQTETGEFEYFEAPLFHESLVFVEVDETVEVGDIYADGEFSKPPDPTPNQVIYGQIMMLEATVTPRRYREAVLGMDGGWLAALEDEIEDLRAQLT